MNDVIEDYEYILDDYKNGYKMLFEFNNKAKREECKNIKLKFKNMNHPWAYISDIEEEMKKYIRKPDEILAYVFDSFFDNEKKFVNVDVYYKYIKIEGYDDWLEFFEYCRNGGEFDKIYIYNKYLESDDNDIPYSLWCEIYREKIEGFNISIIF